KAAVTLLDPAGFRRAYSHCRACREGFCPWDAVLGLGASDATPAAREGTCMAGAIDAFGQVAFALARMSGLRLSEAPVRRPAQAAGADIGRRLAGGETF